MALSLAILTFYFYQLKSNNLTPTENDEQVWLDRHPNDKNQDEDHEW